MPCMEIIWNILEWILVAFYFTWAFAFSLLATVAQSVFVWYYTLKVLEWLTPKILLEKYVLTSQIIYLFSVLVGIASFIGAYYLFYLVWTSN